MVYLPLVVKNKEKVQLNVNCIGSSTLNYLCQKFENLTGLDAFGS